MKRILVATAIFVIWELHSRPAHSQADVTSLLFKPDTATEKRVNDNPGRFEVAILSTAKNTLYLVYLRGAKLIAHDGGMLFEGTDSGVRSEGAGWRVDLTKCPRLYTCRVKVNRTGATQRVEILWLDNRISFVVPVPPERGGPPRVPVQPLPPKPVVPPEREPVDVVVKRLASTSKRVLVVPKHYPTVQQAVAKARDGDAVLLAADGTDETVDLQKKTLTIHTVYRNGPVVVSSAANDTQNIEVRWADNAIRFKVQPPPTKAPKILPIARPQPAQPPTLPQPAQPVPPIPGRRIIHVPRDYAKIQQAIEESDHGDEVVVAPGVYKGKIDFIGRSITVRSTDPSDPAIVASTVIDANQRGPAVTFSTRERRRSVITGFTLTGGRAECGGGISCRNSSPTIQGNIITGNYAYFCGGGIDCDESSPLVQNNLIIRNEAQFAGGLAINKRGPVIVNNTLAANKGSRGGGMFCRAAEPTITNCIIAFNIKGAGIEADDKSAPAISYCNLYQNSGGDCVNLTLKGQGNIAADPLFADAAKGDYHLKSRTGRRSGARYVRDSIHSPCIDAGVPSANASNEPAPNGGRINMGAYGSTPQASQSR